MSWPIPLDFWQGVAIAGLALTAIGVGLGVIALVLSGRQQRGLTTLIAGGAERTATLIAGAEERTQRILTRMETNAEARYRDLKDRLDGEEDRP
jgi:hypothetical protein